MIGDEKILEGCIAGNRHAQNQLYQRFAKGMLGVCLRYGKSLVEAEDILQDGFIKVFKNIKDFRNEGSLEGWIRRIMVNTAITHFNKNKMKFIEIDDEIAVQQEEQEEEFNEKIEPEILLNLIQQMPAGYRMVLNLYIFKGLITRK